MPTETNWIPLAKAMRESKRSKATLYRMVAANEIRTLQKSRAGRKPETLFSSSDIAQLATGTTGTSGTLAPLPRPIRQLPPLRMLPAAPIAPSPILTIEQAAEWSQLPRAYLRELATAGTVAAVKRGQWFLSRKSLLRFIQNGFLNDLE